MHAPDEAVHRAPELALEYDLALRLTAAGDVEVLSRLAAAPPMRRAPEADTPPSTLPASQGMTERPPVRQVRCLVGEGFQLQRAIRRQDLVAKKRVAYEMVVSETTLWRALNLTCQTFLNP
jgi:hypothetical protein